MRHTATHGSGRPMKIVVTGANGFLGRHVTRRLLAAGHSVVAFDRAGTPVAGAEVVCGDVRDQPLVRLSLAQADAVVHAAFAPPQASTDDLWSVNVESARSVFAAARDAGVGQLVAISSTVVERTPRRHPVSANAPLSRLDAYRITRAAAEQALLEEAARAPGPRVALVRPATFVGRGQIGAFALQFEAIASGGRVPLLGGGRHRYQVIDVDDLAEGVAKLVELGGGGVFHFGAPAPDDVATMLSTVIDHAGTEAQLLRIPGRPGLMALRTVELVGLPPFADWHHAAARGEDRTVPAERAERELGWHARLSSTEALVAAYDWYAGERAAGRAVRTTHAVPGSHRGIAALGALATRGAALRAGRTTK
jgi:dTDP-glucose 4,6-dehydratase